MEHDFTAFVGENGAGKATLIVQLLRRIRDRGDVAIVYAPPSEFVQHFYDEKRDDITGDVRTHYQLRETLIATLAHVVPGPEVVIGCVYTKFKDEVSLDQPTFDFVLESLTRLKAEALLRSSASSHEIR